MKEGVCTFFGSVFAVFVLFWTILRVLNADMAMRIADDVSFAKLLAVGLIALLTITWWSRQHLPWERNLAHIRARKKICWW